MRNTNVPEGQAGRDNEDLLASAKACLPSMPKEVFDSWLSEFVLLRGWPPVGGSWPGLLRGYTLAQWQSFSWAKRTLDIKWVRWSGRAKRLLDDLRDARFRGVVNNYTFIEDSSERVIRIGDYFRENGRLPGSLILIESDLEWDIVDGCHRLAFCLEMDEFHPELPGLRNFEAWVALPFSMGRKQFRKDLA